ncbi:MAG: hypothetical protein KatS3mg015_2500 [Fimbriimonadales bacterium]|nr:MAG: hypothetical protein KatS3mg015_2500 [Fimbriimonadales bacterium]
MNVPRELLLAYVEGELTLDAHFQVWCALHGLLLWEEAREQLAAEAAEYLRDPERR